MKVVIIGGGIAGVTLGAFLNNRNIEVVINERSAGMPVKGHAFLMHNDGLAILKALNKGNEDGLPGNGVDTFSLCRPDGKEIKHIRLKQWQCIKRIDLIQFLYSLLPADKIKDGRSFSHFIYEDGRVVAAVFQNGDIEYGDVFIGADGGNSKVRNALFGNVAFTPVRVKEIVGVSYNENIARTHAGIFTKFQDKATGLAFGLIPTSGTEFVWFMQYDPSIADVTDSSPEELRSFCLEMISEFPQVVKDILASNDFATSYVWKTRDFDLLLAFHKQNVVLIGDAAHLALPFTSAGTTNAIVDAEVLAACLMETDNYEDAFNRFYAKRAEDVASHIRLGRALKEVFLNPLNHNDDEIPVPLIDEGEDPRIAQGKPIQILYFTDPICSTCWIIQPLLRKLQLEYGAYINIEYRMGGLLPSWDEYTKGKIKQPTDAAEHWEEVSIFHEMPLDGDIWLEDPLPSSFPPSIAFKAAQMQDANMAILFLRRIKEMVFLEKKNIIRWEFIERAAYFTGLDSARLLRDVESGAQELFREDLVLAQSLGVTGFPTLFFRDKFNNSFSLKGYQPYEAFEAIVLQLIPSAQKAVIDTRPESLFGHFPTMTEKEYSLLGNVSREEASVILNALFAEGKLDKYESKNGVIWISKFGDR